MIKNLMLCALVMTVACGGKKQGDTTEGGGGTIDTTAHGDQTDRSGNMIPPEKMDEVTQDLKRKNMIISRCLANATEAGNVKKGTHGKIAFAIKIGTDGHATEVTVVKTSIDSQDVIGCAKKHVEEITFPNLPKPYETSYTYAMEAN
jgi:hypothetical protein